MKAMPEEGQSEGLCCADKSWEVLQQETSQEKIELTWK